MSEVEELKIQLSTVKATMEEQAKKFQVNLIESQNQMQNALKDQMDFLASVDEDGKWTASSGACGNGWEQNWQHGRGGIISHG